MSRFFSNLQSENVSRRIIPLRMVPDYDEFLRLTRSATLVPVAKAVSADLLTPVSAFLQIGARERHSFLLESVEGGEKIGRYTFLGAQPYMIVTARGQEVTIARNGRRERRQASIFQVLKELLGQHHPAPPSPELPPFTSGAVGFFAYDAIRQLEKLPRRARIDRDIPDCVMMFFDRLLAFDHLRHNIQIIAAADLTGERPRQAYDHALRDIAALEKQLTGNTRIRLKPAPRRGNLKMRPLTSREGYMKSAGRMKKYIAAGDIFQGVLSQRIDFKPEVDPFNIYRALRTVNPSPYMYFLRFGDLHVLGSSPEMLVRVTGRRLEYRPIAGTRPRGHDDTEDRRLEDELRANEKERAEHVMLVDLGRNDVGRVSEFGSVQVRDLMYVERYSHVMHLVSAIEGRLRPDLDAIDALAACFPAGTLTGAPKVRAMQIIEELEPVRRGVYGGSVLYADFAGNLDSCIAIRTLIMQGNHASVQAGAGIVADSDPAAEYAECINKAKAVLRAVELARTRARK